MTVGHEMIADVLQEAGIEYVFGIPGGSTGAIYNSLYDRPGVKAILARHEQGAAIMADAYGRATGRPAVVMGQGLFIGSNASFGIMEAQLSSSPMVVLTDTSDGDMAQHPANQSGSGEYGSVDLLTIFRSMSKYTTLATTPKEAVVGLQLAMKHALSGRPGPGVVLMRSRALVGEVDVESAPFIHPTQGYLNTRPSVARPEDAEKAASLLAEAKFPVIVAGNGVHMANGHAELQRLAEMLGAGVATSYKGKSTLPETHPQALGMVGQYGQQAANTVVGRADVVLVVGAKLTSQETVGETPSLFDPKRQTIIQIDVEERNAGWSFPIDLGLIGDAREVMAQIIEALGGGDRNTGERVKVLSALKKKASYYNDPELFMDSSPVLPQRLVRLLQETLDPSTLISLDAGNNRVWMCHHYQSQAPKTIFAPGGMAGMGWSLPAALALKLVHPDRPVVGVTGDGGFMMSVHAISTAIQYDLPVVYVVLNDSSLGMVRHHQGQKSIASEFSETDHGAICRSMGGYGVQVSDSREVPDALRAAFASGKPAVVDVLIDRGPNPDDFRATARRLTDT